MVRARLTEVSLALQDLFVAASTAATLVGASDATAKQDMLRITASLKAADEALAPKAKATA